jgi:hypothetical protein
MTSGLPSATAERFSIPIRVLVGSAVNTRKRTSLGVGGAPANPGPMTSTVARLEVALALAVAAPPRTVSILGS